MRKTLRLFRCSSLECSTGSWIILEHFLKKAGPYYGTYEERCTRSNHVEMPVTDWPAPVFGRCLQRIEIGECMIQPTAIYDRENLLVYCYLLIRTKSLLKV